MAADPLGLGTAAADRAVPWLVGAMAFLAALAVAGAGASAGVAQHWQADVAPTVTIAVTPDAAARTLDRLQRIPGLVTPHALDPAETAALLRPWLGDGAAPALTIIEAGVTAAAPDAATLARLLAPDAPGVTIERNDDWVVRLSQLAQFMQALAALILLLVAAVAMGVTAIATRGALAALRPSIEVVHGLGATDGTIAGLFARRAMRRAASGAAAGTVLAVPLLAVLAALARPLAPGGVPAAVWVALPMIPILSATIGWAIAARTVRRWLQHLP